MFPLNYIFPRKMAKNELCKYSWGENATRKRTKQGSASVQKKKKGFSKSTPKPLLSETQYNSFHPQYKPGGIAPLLKKKSEILRIKSKCFKKRSHDLEKAKGIMLQEKV